MSISTSSLVEKLEIVDNKSQVTPNNEVVLVVGSSGAGKSVFVNCVMGKKMVEMESLNSMETCIACEDQVTEIHHGFSSGTEYPVVCYDATENLSYCDCPALTVNAMMNPETEIANVYGIQKIAQEAHAIKAIVFLISYHALVKDRGSAISDMVAMLSTLFGHNYDKKWLSSVLVLVSKAPPTVNVTAVRSSVLAAASSVYLEPEVVEVLQRLELFHPLDQHQGSTTTFNVVASIQSKTPITETRLGFSVSPSTLLALTSSEVSKAASVDGELSLSLDSLESPATISAIATRVMLFERLRILNSADIDKIANQYHEHMQMNFRQAGTIAASDSQVFAFATDASPTIAEYNPEADQLLVRRLRALSEQYPPVFASSIQLAVEDAQGRLERHAEQQRQERELKERTAKHKREMEEAEIRLKKAEADRLDRLEEERKAKIRLTEANKQIAKQMERSLPPLHVVLCYTNGCTIVRCYDIYRKLKIDLGRILQNGYEKIVYVEGIELGANPNPGYFNLGDSYTLRTNGQSFRCAERPLF